MMNTTDFADAVREDLLPTSDHKHFAELMEMTDRLDDWRQELVKLVQSIDSQMSQAKADAAQDRSDSYAGEITRVEYEARCAQREDWRHRAASLKRACTLRLAEVKELIRQRNIARATQGDITKIKTLISAIAAHREASLNGELEPEDHDLRLWSVLEGFGEFMANRTNAIDRKAWKVGS